MTPEVRVQGWEDERLLLQEFKSLTHVHPLPAVHLGFGKVFLAFMMQVLPHGLLLVSPKDIGSLPTLVKTLSEIISDYGVERQPSRTKPFSAFSTFPFMHRPSMLMMSQYDNAEADFAPPEPEIDFSGSLDIPGVVHVLHNAGRGLETALVKFEEASFRLAKSAIS